MKFKSMKHFYFYDSRFSMLRIRVQTFAYICPDLYCTFLLFEIEIYIFRQLREVRRSSSSPAPSTTCCVSGEPPVGAGAFSFQQAACCWAELTDTARVRQIIISSILKHFLHLVTGVNIISCRSAVCFLMLMIVIVLWLSESTMTQWFTARLLLWLSLRWSWVTCFNLDAGHGVVYQGDRDSLFGFSVAAHRDQQTGWWVRTTGWWMMHKSGILL